MKQLVAYFLKNEWVLIPLLAMIAYANVLFGEFVFDDYSVIVENPLIKDFETFTRGRFWINVNNRPFALLTFWFNYAVGGLAPFGYHVVNTIIHTLCGITGYAFFKELVRLAKAYEKWKWLPLFVAILFVIHPVQTQAVSYITQRMSSLAALLYFVSCLGYLRLRIAEKNKILYAIITILSMISALLTKQNAFTLLIMYPLLEVFFVEGNTFKKLKIFIGIGVVGAIASSIAFLGGGVVFKANTDVSNLTYFLTQLKVLPLYLRQVWFPISLNIDYDVSFSDSFGLSQVIGGAIWVLTFLGAVWSFKRSKLLSFSLVWIMVTMLVEFTIIPIRDVFFEHRLYLPLFGFILLTLVVLNKLVSSVAVRNGIVMICCFALFTGTIYVNKKWQTEVGLWKHTIVKSPNKPRVITSLGYAYLHVEEWDSARVYLQKANAVAPNHIEALDGLGLVYLNKQEHKLAEYYFKSVIQLHPKYDKGFLHLKQLYLKQDKPKKYTRFLKQQIKRNPKNVVYVNQLHSFYLERGERKKAKMLLKRKKI